MLSVTAAIGLGKLIGLSLIKLHDWFCPYKPEPINHSELGSVPALFFDKNFILNLKG
jgi:hypothetical protein